MIMAEIAIQISTSEVDADLHVSDNDDYVGGGLNDNTNDSCTENLWIPPKKAGLN